MSYTISLQLWVVCSMDMGYLKKNVMKIFVSSFFHYDRNFKHFYMQCNLISYLDITHYLDAQNNRVNRFKY